MPPLFFPEESAVRRIVVRPRRIHTVPEGVIQEVSLHPYGLHKEDTNKGKDGSFFEHLSVILLCDTLWVPEFEIGTSLRDKILIAFDRSRRLMMKMVGKAPGEVWDEKEGMKDKTNSAVDPGLSRDRPMTSLRVCSNMDLQSEKENRACKWRDNSIRKKKPYKF